MLNILSNGNKGGVEIGINSTVGINCLLKARIFKHFGAQESIPRNEFRQPM